MKFNIKTVIIMMVMFFGLNGVQAEDDKNSETTFSALSETKHSPIHTRDLDTNAISPVPESGTFSLFMAGLGVIAYIVYRRKIK